MSLKFTYKEVQLFNLLLSVAKAKAPSTVLRVAGGHVRDNLLGIESHDIDIAVDNMSGEAFANLVHEYMVEHNIKHKGEVSVIKANPDQSKHLATAMLNILGMSIDFVNLRKEDYADSRIPTISPGTPEEDASRRDLTINCLFYNLNESKLEDFVGGLEDLKNRIARTPIDPVQTFIDDPLRILRTIRFAARFNLKVVPEIIEAAKNEQVQEAFRNKVSAERIWKELAGQQEIDGKWKPGFMSGPNVVYAVKLLEETKLRDIILGLNEAEMKELQVEMGSFDADQNSIHHDLNIWDHTVSVLEELTESEVSDEKKEETEEYLVLTLAALFHDIGKCDACTRQTTEHGTYTYHGHEDSSAKITEHILKRLKAPAHITDRVVRLVANHMRLHLLPESASSKTLRRFMRDLENDWVYSVMLAISDAYGKKSAKSNRHIRHHYDKFETRMHELIVEMGGKTTIKAPVNGHDLMAIGFSPGPTMGVALKALQEQLLETPNITKEEAIEFIKGLNII